MPETKPKGIKAKVLDIQRTIEVEKSGEHPKYGAFIRDEDVVNAVRAKLNEHGIIVTTRNRNATHTPGTDAQGRYAPSVFLQVDYVFTDVETSEELIFGTIGEGATRGDDVSARKAFTMARKIAFLQLFQIGEVNAKFDADSHEAAVPDAEPAPEQKTEEGKATAESVKELNAQVKVFIDGGIPAKTVSTEGQAISDDILEPGKKMAEWKKDPRVLEELVGKLKTVAATGEVS